MFLKLSVLATSLALASAPALQAQTFSWALRGGITLPVGSVKTDALVGTHKSIGGSNLGAVFSWKLDQVNALQLRTEISGLTRSSDNRILANPPSDYVSLNSSWSIPEVGLDWRRDWNTEGEGWFTEAGIGLAFPKFSLTEHFPQGPGGLAMAGTTDSRQNGKLALQIGAGYHFTKRLFGGMAVHRLPVAKDGHNGFGISNLEWMDLHLGYRFGAGR